MTLLICKKRWYYVFEMMRNKLSAGFSTVTVILTAIVVLAGIGAAVMMSQRGATPSASNVEKSMVEQKTASKTAAIDNVSSTFPDIVGKGKNLECDWKIPNPSAATNPFGQGKLYTTANKGRSALSGNVSGTVFDANAIYKDNSVYSWIDFGGNKTGFKFDPEELTELNSNMTPEQKQQAEQIKSEMIFNCKSWTPDESKFVLPTGVDFK